MPQSPCGTWHNNLAMPKPWIGYLVPEDPKRVESHEPRIFNTPLGPRYQAMRPGSLLSMCDQPMAFAGLRGAVTHTNTQCQAACELPTTSVNERGKLSIRKFKQKCKVAPRLFPVAGLLGAVHNSEWLVSYSRSRPIGRSKYIDLDGATGRGKRQSTEGTDLERPMSENSPFLSCYFLETSNMNTRKR